MGNKKSTPSVSHNITFRKGGDKTPRDVSNGDPHLGESDTAPSVSTNSTHRNEGVKTLIDFYNGQLRDTALSNSQTCNYEHKGGEDLRYVFNWMLWSLKLSESDKALVREARSVVSHEKSYFKTDYELKISLSCCEHCFWNGNRTTKLIVQRKGSDEIEAVFNGRTIRMYLRDGIEKVAKMIWEFFTGIVAPVFGTILKTLPFM